MVKGMWCELRRRGSFAVIYDDSSIVSQTKALEIHSCNSRQDLELANYMPYAWWKMDCCCSGRLFQTLRTTTGANFRRWLLKIPLWGGLRTEPGCLTGSMITPMRYPQTVIRHACLASCCIMCHMSQCHHAMCEMPGLLLFRARLQELQANQEVKAISVKWSSWSLGRQSLDGLCGNWGGLVQHCWAQCGVVFPRTLRHTFSASFCLGVKWIEPEAFPSRGIQYELVGGVAKKL